MPSALQRSNRVGRPLAFVLAALLAGAGCARHVAESNAASVRSVSSAPQSTASVSASLQAGLPEVTLIPPSAPQMKGVAIRPDGRAIAVWHSGFANGRNAESGLEAWELGGDPVVRSVTWVADNSWNDLSFSAAFWTDDGGTLIGAFSDRVVVWSLPQGKPLLSDAFGEARVAMSHDLRHVLVADEVGTEGVIDVRHPQPATHHELYRGLTGATDTVEWLSDRVGAVITDGHVFLVDAKDGAIRQDLGVDMVAFPVLAASSDRIAIGAGDGSLRLLEVDTLTPTRTLTRATPQPGNRTVPAKAVAALAFSHDGRTLAVSRHDGTLEWWDVAKGIPTGVSTGGHPCTASDAAYQPRLAFSSSDKYAGCLTEGAWSIWQTGATGAPRDLPRGDAGWVAGADRMLVVDDLGDVTEWDASNPTEARRAFEVSRGPGFFTADFRFRVSYGDEIRLERMTDGRAVRLRAIEVGKNVVPAIYTHDLTFQGDDDICRAVLALIAGQDAPTARECALRRRPHLVADFYAGRSFD